MWFWSTATENRCKGKYLKMYWIKPCIEASNLYCTFVYILRTFAVSKHLWGFLFFPWDFCLKINQWSDPTSVGWSWCECGCRDVKSSEVAQQSCRNLIWEPIASEHTRAQDVTGSICENRIEKARFVGFLRFFEMCQMCFLLKNKIRETQNQDGTWSIFKQKPFWINNFWQHRHRTGKSVILCSCLRFGSISEARIETSDILDCRPGRLWEWLSHRSSRTGKDQPKRDFLQHIIKFVASHPGGRSRTFSDQICWCA